VITRKFPQLTGSKVETRTIQEVLEQFTVTQLVKKFLSGPEVSYFHALTGF
jgi:hypothetical protein